MSNIVATLGRSEALSASKAGLFCKRSQVKAAELLQLTVKHILKAEKD